MNERAKTVRGLLDEHRRRRAAVGSGPRKVRSLRTQIPSTNPVNKWYKDNGIDISDVRQGFDMSGGESI